MELIGYYLLFALTTSIVAIYELIKPVLWELSLDNPDDLILRSKYTSYFVFFVAGIALAPALIFPCLIPRSGEAFRVALLKSLRA